MGLMGQALHGRHFLRAAGISAWVLSGAPAVMMLMVGFRIGSREVRISPERFAWWLGAALVFAFAFWASSGTPADSRHRRRAQGLLLVQSAAALAMFQVVCTGLETMLLMVVAAQLGLFVRLRAGVLWILVQSALLCWLGIAHAGLYFSVGWTLLSLPFAALAMFVSYYAAAESQARRELARANAELRATQEILAESRQLAERTRISRELHDVLGHHLTALSLNLEAARHTSEGAPREQIEKCQGLTKQLLADVREVVRTLRTDEPVDLERILAPLVEDIPRPQIHLRVPRDVSFEDPERAHALVRCIQEIVTNAVKHARAQNLWIELERGEGGILIHARDDGQGARELRPGHGLTGMRERLEKLGGRLELRSPPRQGFFVDARIPIPETP